MRGLRFIVVLSLCSLNTGCLLLTGARNLLVEPVAQYTLECFEFKRNETLAVNAWQAVCAMYPENHFSIHYAEGFRQGFVDYLNAGGTGAPPPVPPRKYWGVRYETPQGHSAMQDWFAGFRHGSDAAAESGYRQFVVLPTPIPPVSEQLPTRSGSTEQKEAAPATEPEQLQHAPREVPVQPE